ncbi:MAG: polysaccharide deacetylase family protein [Frankiales bacterium]|nr:polysaccharide deacetylase family protein [Frankiales bacterium]
MNIPRRRALQGLAVGALALASACGRSGSKLSAPAAAPEQGPTAPASARPSAATTAAQPATPQGTPPGPATQVFRGSGARAEVALTFHLSGDPTLVEPLLVAAERAGARVTAFAVGSWLAEHPQFAARILRGGHELANHTWSHPNLSGLGASALDAEVVRCRDVLTRLGGRPGALFRPSRTKAGTPAVLAAAGLAGYRTCLGWDVDPEDFRDPGQALVQRRVLDGVTAGSVVSMHFGHRGTIEALPGILSDLSGRGLKAVTATELLASSS